MSFNKDNLYWEKNDGEKVLISEMSNSHLLKTLTRLESTAKDEKGKVVKIKLHPKYNVLKLNALARDLI